MSGLEIIAFILGTTGPIQQSFQLINTFKQHYQACKSNPQLIEDILRSLEQHSSNLQQLSAQLHQHKFYISDENQTSIDRSLSQVKQVLEDTLHKLKEMEKTIGESKLLKHIKASTISTKYHNIMKELNESHKTLQNINAVMTNVSSNISITTEQTGQLIKKMGTNQEQMRNQLVSRIDRISIGCSSDFHPADQYRPQRQSLQYSHAAKINFDEKEKDGKFVSVEGKIKHELLNPCHPGQNILGIQGEAGVGKSTILGMLTQNGEIGNHFTNGVYCMKFGADANTKTLMEEIVKIVRACGGYRLSEKMNQIDNIYKVMEKACDWFREKQILLAVDDIWYKDGSGVEIVGHLSRLVRSGSNAAMVYTTRDPKVAQIPTFGITRRGDPFSTECQSILMRHCQCDEEIRYDEETEEAIKYLLKICHGLPAAHGVVGKAVREYALSCRSGMSGAWKWYKHTHGSIVESNGDEYGNLHSAFMTALKILDEGDEINEASKVRNGKQYYSYRKMHHGLCVLEKQQRCPMSMLVFLWSIEGEEDDMNRVKKICERFVRVGLAEWNHTTRTTRMNNQKNRNDDNDRNDFIECISIHDLLYDFAMNEAKRNGEIEEWHDRVIEGYKKRYNININEKKGCEEWWQVEKMNENRDGYFLKNACRHMRLSKNRREKVVDLVTRPEWIGAQVCNNGIIQYGEDMKYAIKCMDNDAEEKKRCGEELEDEYNDVELSIMDLRLVHEAVRLSAVYIQRNRKEMWFQLYDRLTEKANESSWLNSYLMYIEKNAPRIWLRSLQPCLIGVGSDFTPVGNNTNCMVVLSGGEEVACGCRNGDIVIVNIKHKYTKNVWHAHNDAILCIKASEDGKYLISGSRDGTAKVWDGKTFGLKSVLTGHTDHVRTVWIGNEGTTAFTASQDGTVRKWDVQKGEQLGENCSDGEESEYLAVLEHEKVIIFAGMHGKKICRRRIESEWDGRKSGHLWPRRLNKRNEKQATVENSIHAFALSKDERRLAIATHGPNLSIWNTKTMKQIQNIDTSNYIGKNFYRIAFSDDGTRLVCGSNEGDILVYDLNNGKMICESMNGGFFVTGLEFIRSRDEIVYCSSAGRSESWRVADISSKASTSSDNRQKCFSVAITPDGSQIVTGHRRGILRTWDTSTSSLTRQSEEVCDSDFQAVTVSPDGERIFCGCLDGSIQVVNTNTLKRIISLEGHNQLINCIDITRDGNHLSTGSDDNTIRIWDINKCDGTHITVDVGEDVWQVFISEDERRIVCLLSPGFSIQVWDIKKKKCILEKEIETHIVSRKEAMILANEIEEDETNNSETVYYDFGSREIRYGSFDNYEVLGTLEVGVREWKYEMSRQVMCLVSRSRKILFLRVEGELEEQRFKTELNK